MLLTRNNQDPFNLASEFIKGVQQAPVVMPEMNAVFDKYVELEKKHEPLPEVMAKTITHVGNNAESKLNGREVKFIKNCQPKLSDYFLSWICSQSDANPAYINTVVGLYCTYFYHYYSKDETLTIEWLKKLGCGGKIFDFNSIFPWFAASKTSAGQSIFELMTAEDLYTAK